MRILMVVRQFFPWVGGTEMQAHKLATRLIDLGVDVTVVTGWWFWGTSRYEIIGGVPVFRNFTNWEMFGIKGLRKFGGYLYILSLFWYLWRQRHNYDLIHIHLLSYAAFPSILASRFLGKKTIIKIANSGQYSDIRRMQVNEMLPGQRQMLPVALEADRLVAINQKIVDELKEVGVPLERIAIIPNGVEMNGIYKFDYTLGDTITVIFVGRLHPQKALDVLLAAFKDAVSRRPEFNWHLRFVGDGPSRSELERLTGQLGLTQQIEFCGQVTDVSTYLMQADIFVLPSCAEGMSNALLEAMAHGLPCVATQINGNIDVIQHELNGLLVPFGSSTQLASALIHLADDENLRQKLGQSARLTVQAEYSIDSVAKRYLQLYDTLLTA